MKRREKLWAVTAYFNPQNYQTRLANYHIFREHLRLPLITVELSFDSNFYLQKADAEILVQIACGDVLWQKERLLNLACENLPPECDAVAWLDCDIVLESDSWAKEAYQLLDEYPLVQAFQEQYSLGPETRDFAENRQNQGDRKSLAYCWEQNLVPSSYFTGRGLGRSLGIAAGYAYVTRRPIIEQYELYDAFVVGGADKMMAAAALGRASESARAYGLSTPSERHFLRWAKAFYAGIQGRISYVNGNLYHLWHGSLKNRNHVSRHAHLKRFNFDPLTDIRLSSAGSWEWSSPKRNMHRFVEDYFAAWREDTAEDAMTASGHNARPSCGPRRPHLRLLGD